MDKLRLTGQNQGRVFNFRSGHLHFAKLLVLSVKLPNLQLKTRLKQLLGYLPLVIAHPALIFPENIRPGHNVITLFKYVIHIFFHWEAFPAESNVCRQGQEPTIE
jgi:hypothetical protein